MSTHLERFGSGADAAVGSSVDVTSNQFRALSWASDRIVQHTKPQEALAAVRAKQPTWIDMGGRDETNELVVGPNGLNLHSLTIEDVFCDLDRPKIEEFPEYVYLLFHAMEPDPSSKSDEAFERSQTEVDLVLGENYLLTHHGHQSRAINSVFEEVLRGASGLRRGPAYVAHLVLDSVIDEYGPILDSFDAEIEQIEHDILAENAPDPIPRIFSCKRRLQQIRRVSIHQKEVLHRLARHEFPQIPEALSPFFRDVYDHYSRATDLAESYRDLLANALEAHLSVQSNRMNAIMKTLTLATTLFMPLTFIVGLYGMNFEHMPELKTKAGYPIVLGLMLCIVVGLLVFFRKKKWL